MWQRLLFLRISSRMQCSFWHHCGCITDFLISKTTYFVHKLEIMKWSDRQKHWSTWTMVIYYPGYMSFGRDMFHFILKIISPAGCRFSGDGDGTGMKMSHVPHMLYTVLVTVKLYSKSYSPKSDLFWTTYLVTPSVAPAASRKSPETFWFGDMT